MKGDSNSTYPLVSIVSVNYNQPEATLDMLDSLSKLTYPNFEVIVVDNASTSGDISIIKRHHPDVQLIISDENLGFAGGNNLGIKASQGDYIMLLNNDTVADPGFLEPLVHKFLSELKPGAGEWTNNHFTKLENFGKHNDFVGACGIKVFLVNHHKANQVAYMGYHQAVAKFYRHDKPAAAIAHNPKPARKIDDMRIFDILMVNINRSSFKMNVFSLFLLCF